MTTQTIGVTGGVDTHSNTHHAAAIDEVGRLLGTREFAANLTGYEQLLGCWSLSAPSLVLGSRAPAVMPPVWLGFCVAALSR
jgi:hypothetical protein